MRGKILIKNQGGQKHKIKVRYLALALMMIGATCGIRSIANAVSCPDLRVVFARGSGGERWTNSDYLEFKRAIESKLATVSLDYEFIDLDYPAVGVGVDKLDVSLGAYFGAGESYEFGDSVKSGVKNLDKMVNSAECPGTKYVLGGYSQGALVTSKALPSLKPERVIYSATFGDPKVYLPEGKGIIPPACKGQNLSSYRMYVPDCQAYKGLLGAHIPYEPESLMGKVGTWCNKRDIFCSSHLSMSDHLAYISENLYEDASRVIFDKICKHFGLENTVSSPHDTAILIDSTGSMASMIDKYKTEALRLARETLDSGGRVALYDYRDLKDPYAPVKHCDFDSCTLEIFESELQAIKAHGGGDTPESLLSASFHVMSELSWKYGSTKSLVVLTDANFLSPDRDGMTFDEVVRLSKQIDPVNFYIITNASYGNDYADLAEATDGKVVTNFDELSLLTDYIMERYDSLPRVEESLEVENVPTAEVIDVGLDGPEAKVSFVNSTGRALVILNDTVLGITNDTEINIGGLDLNVENNLIIVPLGDDIRGEAVEVRLNTGGMNATDNASASPEPMTSDLVMPDSAVSLPKYPKAPNTGKR